MNNFHNMATLIVVARVKTKRRALDKIHKNDVVPADPAFWAFHTPHTQKVKDLLIHTLSVRRTEILNADNLCNCSTNSPKVSNAEEMLSRKTKVLCKTISCGSLHIQVKLEFELTMQKLNLKDEFDGELVL